MKKLLVISIMILMVFSMLLPAYAEGFVSSPSRNKAPVLVSAVAEKNDRAGVTVVAYADRDQLDANAKADIEAAYASIVDASGAAALNAELADEAAKVNVPAADLAVSDLFDLSPKSYDPKADGDMTVKLEADTLGNFVGCLHFKDNAWELVEDAEVEAGVITFTVSEFSPFAFVVSTGAVPTPSESGMSGAVIAIIVVAAVLVIGAAVFFLFFFKKNKKEKTA